MPILKIRKPLKKRLTLRQRNMRVLKMVMRAMTAQDRDTRKWAAERKIHQRFQEAAKRGMKKGGPSKSHLERLHLLGLFSAEE